MPFPDKKSVPHSIGVVGERSLHSTLKFLYEPDPAYHEVTIGGHIADICRDGHVIEIQTGSFVPLRGRLAELLPLVDVTIICPVERTRYLVWIDPQTGETTIPRRSPRTGRLCDAFIEISRIRSFIPDNRLEIRLLPFDVTEYRLRDGWGGRGKRGSHRVERRPIAFGDETVLCTADDYSVFLPDMPDGYTAQDFRRNDRLSARSAQSLLITLTHLGLLERTRDGRAYRYSKANQS